MFISIRAYSLIKNGIPISSRTAIQGNEKWIEKSGKNAVFALVKLVQRKDFWFDLLGNSKNADFTLKVIGTV